MKKGGTAMNKQELIDKWKSKTEAPTPLNSLLFNNIDFTRYTAGYSVARTEIIKDLKQLDEPQKPVVPKFVAEWIELCKEKADLISCLSGSYEYGVNQYKRITEDEDWLFEADHQELVARAWLYGYEVEKEPMYRVKLGEGYFVEYQGRGALIIPDDNKEIKMFNSKSDAERTAQTIGGTVEEVVEG